MTDVEIAEQAIATLHEKLHVATKRAHEIAADRQRLSYTVFVDGDPSARADLEKLNAIAIADKIENIKAAIAEANKRLTAARDAVARDADKEHARNAVAILEDLVALAPKLDELVPHPRPEDGVKFYCQNDPPTCCQAAKLMAVLVNEHLRALKLTEASFPKSGHGAANKQDLEREFMKTIAAGWPYLAVQLAPRQRTSVMPGQPPRTPEFTKILGGWGAVIRKSLVQYEQMNREEAHAA
jgi:hypothetical protein